jgi:hypothetical protein
MPAHFFPLVWDSTQLAEAKSCEIRAFRRYIQHFNSPESIDLIAGGAFAHGIHKGRNAFYVDNDPNYIEVGIEALTEHYGDFYDPWKPAKSLGRMQLALESYFNQYDLRFDDVQPLKLEDGSYAVEYSLLAPILDMQGNPILHPTLKLPLLFSGRLDMLASYAGGIYIVDEKTTGSYFSKSWAQQWETRGQFTGYKWLGQQTQIPILQNLSGAIIRGICLPTSTATNEDTKQKFYSNIESIKHQQALTTRSQYEVDNWHRDMVRTIQHMLTQYTAYMENGETEPEKFFSGNWGSSCTDYGKGCTLIDTCKSANGERFLEGSYEQYIWRPEQHKRQLLSEYLEEIHTLVCWEQLAKDDPENTIKFEGSMNTKQGEPV